MTSTVPDILARIIDRKQQDLPAVCSRRAELEELAERANLARRDFQEALLANHPAIIAEVKKASPSRGIFAHDFQPATIAGQYAAGGAAALSVLTDEPFFQGSLADLAAARGAVNLPVIRKDFTIDEAHVIEAAAHHADAILLIAAILTEREMRDFRELAARYRMAALVEVHDAEEQKKAIASGAVILGVNNRNLHTFGVRLETSLDLASSMPAGAVLVSESGIRSRADIARLTAAGYHAFLIGEHLMTSGDPTATLRALRS